MKEDERIKNGIADQADRKRWRASSVRVAIRKSGLSPTSLYAILDGKRFDGANSQRLDMQLATKLQAPTSQLQSQTMAAPGSRYISAPGNHQFCNLGQPTALPRGK
jgi:hypothetical protein